MTIAGASRENRGATIATAGGGGAAAAVAVAGVVAPIALDSSAGGTLAGHAVTKDWVAAICNAHQLTPAGQKIAAKLSSEFNARAVDLNTYVEYDLKFVLLDCYALLKKFPLLESIIVPLYFFNSGGGFATGKLSRETLQQRGENFFVNNAAERIDPPIDEICFKIVQSIQNLENKWRILKLSLPLAGFASPIWDYMLTFHDSLLEYSYIRGEIRIQIGQAPSVVLRKLALQNTSHHWMGVKCRLALIQKSEEQEDYDEVFEYAKRLDLGADKLDLLHALITCEKNVRRMEVGKYALKVAEEKALSDEEKAMTLASVLHFPPKTAVPKITRDARQLTRSISARACNFVYERLLKLGDRNQFNEIVQEAFAHGKQNPNSSNDLFSTLLDVTSGQIREEILTYIHETASRCSYSVELRIKCADNPPERLRNDILSLLFNETTWGWKCNKDRALLYTAYLKLARAAECKENIDPIYQFANDMVEEPELQILQAQLFGELLKKVEGQMGPVIFDEAFSTAQSMKNPLARAVLVASLLVHSQQFSDQSKQEQLRQYALALLHAQEATPDVKHILGRVLSEEGAKQEGAARLEDQRRASDKRAEGSAAF